MNGERTKLNRIAIGSTFVLPGDTEVFTKLKTSDADRSMRRYLVRNGAGEVHRMSGDTFVVPSEGATTEDILASWRSL